MKPAKRQKQPLVIRPAVAWSDEHGDCFGCDITENRLDGVPVATAFGATVKEAEARAAVIRDALVTAALTEVA